MHRGGRLNPPEAGRAAVAGMQEILPGVHHWTGYDEEVRAPVHSYYVEPAGVLIDALVPDDGLGAFEGLVTPRQAILTNSRHFRHSDRFREAFGCAIRAAHTAMPALEGRDVEPFWFGDDVAVGVTAIEIGPLGPEETALHITHGPGAIALGDGLVHEAGAPLAFAPDDMLGKRPDRARHGLKNELRAMLARDFDALLFSHGDPLAEDGKKALRRFVEAPSEYPEFGPYA
jgi:hypothetical protein